jgi:hypothetical protein
VIYSYLLQDCMHVSPYALVSREVLIHHARCRLYICFLLPFLYFCNVCLKLSIMLFKLAYLFMKHFYDLIVIRFLVIHRNLFSQSQNFLLQYQNLLLELLIKALIALQILFISLLKLLNLCISLLTKFLLCSSLNFNLSCKSVFPDLSSLISAFI